MRTKNTVLVIVFLLVGGIAGYFIGAKSNAPVPVSPSAGGGGTHKPVHPIGKDIADGAVSTFRDSINRKQVANNGVYLDTADMQAYVDSLSTFIRQQKQDTVTLGSTKYSWKIGFYFMDKNKNDKKLSFCMAPILVDVADSLNVLDYFNPLRPHIPKSDDPYSDGIPLLDEVNPWP